MSTIKDLFDLVVKLRDEHRETWIAPIHEKFHLVAQRLQAENFELVEKNAELVTENLDLKRKIREMEETHPKVITALQQKHRQEIDQLVKASNMTGYSG